MNHSTAAELKPLGRFEWERIVRRVVVPKPVKLVLLVLATYADADGTRVRPGNDVLAAVTGDGEKNVRRIVAFIRDLGLIQLTSRGGGRGGKGKASEYRLTIPVDLLDRVPMLDPDGRPADRPDIWMSAQSPVDNQESPDIQVSAHCGQSPVDNSVSPDTQMSTQSGDPQKNDRTSGDPSRGMSGHLATNDRTSRCPTTSHDHPPKATTPPVVEDVTTVPSPTVDVDNAQTQMSGQSNPTADPAEHEYRPGPLGMCELCHFPEANSRHRRRYLRAI